MELCEQRSEAEYVCACNCVCIRQGVVLAGLTSVFAKIACLLDNVTCDTSCNQQCPDCTVMSAQVDCAKQLLVTLFQMANLLLLLASIVESAVLVQLYVWYTLGFVVMGLIVAIVDFLCKFKSEGNTCFLEFVTEVVFLFVIFRCLPLVDTYRKHISGESSITS